MMKCTSCSEDIKPIVAIDIDGTLGDYHGHLLNFVEAYIGHEPTDKAYRSYGGKERFRVWVARSYGISIEEFRDIKLAWRQGAGKRLMCAYAGAAALCDAVQECGGELWITTTRPFQRLDNVDPDTRAWLDRNGIHPDGLLYDSNKYEKLAKMIDPDRVVAVLDDLHYQVDAATTAFGIDVPILRRTLYNRDIFETREVDDLEEAKLEVVHRIHEWYDLNQRSNT